MVVKLGADFLMGSVCPMGSMGSVAGEQILKKSQKIAKKTQKTQKRGGSKTPLKSAGWPEERHRL
jgi:hypothetical protein